MEQEQRQLRKLRHRGASAHRRAGRTRLPWKRTLLLVFLLTGSFVASIGEENRAAFAEVLLDPLSLLAQRSPGERGAGALLQTKPPKVHLAAATPGPFGPSERVLSEVRTRPPIEFGPDIALLGPIVPDIAEPDFVVPETLPDIGPRMPGLPFIGPGPNPTSLCCDVPQPAPSVPVPGSGPIVPEPATWLTMILGMLAVGGALRRRRAHETGDDMGRHAGA